MKRLLIDLAERAWAWASAWFQTPAGQRAAAGFLTELSTHVPDFVPAAYKPTIHLLAIAILSSGVLHASRQGPEPPPAEVAPTEPMA